MEAPARRYESSRAPRPNLKDGGYRGSRSENSVQQRGEQRQNSADTRGFAREDSFENDFISSYADPSPRTSPTKPRPDRPILSPASNPDANGGSRERKASREEGSRRPAEVDAPRAPPKEREDKERRTKSSKDGKSPPKTKDGRKPGVPFDVIDQLDVTGLYGGGALYRHDGPYAAASAGRNKGPQAPMAAFDPSALAPPAPSPKPRQGGGGGISSRAQAAMLAMEENDFGISGSGGGYGAAASENKPLIRRNSDSSIKMGFPSSAAKGKGQQLVEIYGVRESEAWEDYGTGRYGTNGSAAPSTAGSRESVAPKNESKQDRMNRHISVWDMEATLRAGKPVGAAPPPMPAFPSNLSSSLGSAPPLPGQGQAQGQYQDVKRSKSLARRLKTAYRNPNNPMDDENYDEDEDDEDEAPNSAPAGQTSYSRTAQEQREQYRPSPNLGGSGGSSGGGRMRSNSTPKLNGSASSNPERQYPSPSLSPPGGSPTQPREKGLRFGQNSERYYEPTQEERDEKASGNLDRRPSMVSRWFKKKN